MEKLSSIPNSVGEVSIAGIKGEIAGYVTTVIITPAMKEGNQYLNTNPNNSKHANAILSVLNANLYNLHTASTVAK